MSSKLAISLIALLAAASEPAAAKERSESGSERQATGRSTVTILSGARLNWSSSDPERLVLSHNGSSESVTKWKKVDALKPEGITYYVDFK